MPRSPQDKREHLKAWGFRIVILCSSILLCLIVAEIALRFMHVERTGTGHHQLFCEHHALLGWQKIPNFSGIHIGPNNVYRITETMNSKGLRGPEYSYKKPNDEYRIIALGDSFTEGYTVEFKDLFTEVLKKRLNDIHDHPVEVINAGTGGYSTDQELLWLRSEGFKYDPDLVILMLCENDILYNTVNRYWRGFKPMFRIENDRLVLTNVPVPPPISLQAEDTARKNPESSPRLTVNHSAVTKSPLLKLKLTLYNSSHLYRHIREQVVSNPQISEFLVKAGLAHARKKIPRYKRFSNWKQATKAEREDALYITELLLATMNKETQDVSAEFVVMIIPGNNAVTRAITEICSKHSISCIDPSKKFSLSDTKLDFAPYDSHWNAAGHKLAATILLEKIQSDLKPKTRKKSQSLH